LKWMIPSHIPSATTVCSTFDSNSSLPLNTLGCGSGVVSVPSTVTILSLSFPLCFFFLLFQKSDVTQKVIKEVQPPLTTTELKAVYPLLAFPIPTKISPVYHYSNNNTLKYNQTKPK